MFYVEQSNGSPALTGVNSIRASKKTPTGRPEQKRAPPPTGCDRLLRIRRERLLFQKSST